MEWWVWITRWSLFSIRYSRLCCAYHKKHEALPTNPPVYIYINRINNRLVFKIKDGYELKLQTPKTMKYITKKLIDKTKSGENPPSLEVVEIVLVM